MKRKICLLLVLSLALGLFAFPGASAGEERVSCLLYTSRCV